MPCLCTTFSLFIFSTDIEKRRQKKMRYIKRRLKVFWRRLRERRRENANESNWPSYTVFTHMLFLLWLSVQGSFFSFLLLTKNVKNLTLRYSPSKFFYAVSVLFVFWITQVFRWFMFGLIHQGWLNIWHPSGLFFFFLSEVSLKGGYITRESSSLSSPPRDSHHYSHYRRLVCMKYSGYKKH